MRFYTNEIKEKAKNLRKSGKTIGFIEKLLDIPRSTLSTWFQNTILTPRQLAFIKKQQQELLKPARAKAVLWHNKQKEKRLLEAKKRAEATLKKIRIKNTDVLKLALALLYLGEGTKNKIETSVSNSDPKILRFFIKASQTAFNVKPKDIKCYLYLRADQNKNQSVLFWSKILSIPIKNFRGVNIDHRTKNSKTFENYKGVCSVILPTVAIKRELMYLAESYCEKIINNIK